MRILLTAEELEYAQTEALDQRRRAVENRREHRGRPGASEDDQLRWHVWGMLGELAVSRLTGFPVTSHRVYDPRATDVGPYQVKATRRGNPLLVHEKDQANHRPSTPYILTWVQDDSPLVEIVGWLPFGQIALDEHWIADWRKWSVPHSKLLPMSDLP
jgi:hypothetical protein